jgi:hypothetical protein
MKTLFTAFTLTAILGACSNVKTPDNNLTAGNDRELPISYVATIRDNGGNLENLTATCAAKVKRIANITDVEALGAIGSVTFSASSQDALMKVKATGCFASIEKGGKVGFELPVSYIATIKSNGGNIESLTTACAAKIARIDQVTDLSALEALGMITFTTSSKVALEKVKKTACVATVEEGGAMHN